MKVLKSRLGDKKNLKFEFDKRTMEFRDINDVGDSDGNGQTAAQSCKSALGLPKCQVDDHDLFGDDLGMP
jgi:hypothetical protein